MIGSEETNSDENRSGNRRPRSEVGPHHPHVLHARLRRAAARVRVERVHARVPAEDAQAALERVPRGVAHDRRAHVREHVHLAHELAEQRERRVVRGGGRVVLRGEDAALPALDAPEAEEGGEQDEPACACVCPGAFVSR